MPVPRRTGWPPELAHEIRRLRKVYPNLGKLPLSVLLIPWCNYAADGRVAGHLPDGFDVMGNQ